MERAAKLWLLSPRGHPPLANPSAALGKGGHIPSISQQVQCTLEGSELAKRGGKVASMGHSCTRNKGSEDVRSMADS